AVHEWKPGDQRQSAIDPLAACSNPRPNGILDGGSKGRRAYPAVADSRQRAARAARAWASQAKDTERTGARATRRLALGSSESGSALFERWQSTKSRARKVASDQCR